MKIGLYFGSFNPIHVGHCIVASYVANFTTVDQVWLIISPQNPFKASASLLNEYHRLHLAKLALADSPNLKASDFEFQLSRPSYTVDTLAHFTEKYPQHVFTIIMGSDSYQNLPKWKNAQVIMSSYEILVYLRPGFPINAQDNANVTLLEAPLLQISSTHIRESVKNGKSIRFLVHDNVMEEIERNGYYR
jgi:nicotinate-nucleotide adenylyltransferase